jgi:hypothetical protein
MAVLAIASIGALPLRTFADDGAAAKPHSVDALMAVLADASNRAGAGARIEEFFLADASLFGADVDKAKFGGLAREWGTTKGKVADVAELYFIIGPGTNAPDWTKSGKNFAPLKKHAEWEGLLRGALTKNHPPKGGDWTGKILEVANVDGFLNEAVVQARAILNAPGTHPELDISIGGNKPPVVDAPAVGGGGNLAGVATQYTYEEMYKEGARHGLVRGPKDAHDRAISLKIYTRRLPDLSIVNEIGIYDITVKEKGTSDDTHDIFGQRFPVGGPNQSFVLDDRTGGNKAYELKFETLPNGDRKVIFQRPGGGVKIETTVSELYLKRADQAAELKHITNVNGEKFYALPQGGTLGAVLMFPKDLLDGRADVKDPRDLVPSLYAEIGKRGSDGRTENLPGKPMLGKVGDKDYHVLFNAKLGQWEVKEGIGDLPPKPQTPPTNSGDGNPINGGKSIAELEALLPDCKKNPDDVNDLAANLKGQYSVVVCENKIDGRKPIIFVPKTAGTPDQQLAFEGLRRGRFFDHYLVLEFDKGVQYQDVLKTTEKGYYLAGSVDLTKKHAADFEDMGIFLDALKRYVIPAGSADLAALTEVPKRVVAANLGSNPFRLTGGDLAEGSKNIFKVVLKAMGDTGEVWPKNSFRAGTPTESQAPYTNRDGPGNAMDAMKSSEDAPIPGELLLEASSKALVYKNNKTVDYALFETVDVLVGKPEPKKYYLMFRFNTLDPENPAEPKGKKVKRVLRTKQIEVFNDANPLPANFSMAGLTADEKDRPASVVEDRVVSLTRFVDGSNKERGVYALFQKKLLSGEGQREPKANCAGPLIWWGLASRGAALEICEKDAFGR